MFAGHHKLDNLIAITDYNKLQIDGFTDDVLTLEPLADKWRAFNWEVLEMDGHDWDDIYETMTRREAVTGKPAMIIAHTIKAQGLLRRREQAREPQHQGRRPGGLRRST